MKLWLAFLAPLALLASKPCKKATPIFPFKEKVYAHTVEESSFHTPVIKDTDQSLVKNLSPSAIQFLTSVLQTRIRMPPPHTMTEGMLLPLVRRLETTYERQRRFLYWGISEPQLLHGPLRALMDRDVRPIEEVLKNGRITEKRSQWNDTGLGVSDPLLITLEDGTKGVWKSSQRAFVNYRAEVLAYELSELLDLNLVPPTVQRDIDGTKGSLQLFVEGTLWFNTPNKSHKRRKRQRFFRRQGFFDYLIGNRDRNEGNVLSSPKGKMYSIDHSYAFFDFTSDREATLRQKALKATRAFVRSEEGRTVVERLGSLDWEELYIQVRHYIGTRRAEYLMDRVDLLITGKVLDDGGGKP